MLESMRNAAKSWVAKVLMALLVLSFSIWGIKDVSSSFSDNLLGWFGWGPKDLAKVAGKTILASDYTTALQKTLRLMSQQSGQQVTTDDAHKMGVDKQVLDSLIARLVIDAQREKLGLAMSDATIAESVYSNKIFQDSSGKFDSTIFQRLLAQNGLNEATFFASERTGRLRAAVTDIAGEDITLPKTYALALAQFAGQTRDARYFTVTANESDVAAPTDAELKKQYESSPATYTAPEYRSVALMKVDPADIAAKITVTPDDVKAGYDKYKKDYFKPETRTLLQVSFANAEA
ncbi:MAG: SurA N-terminal domain-containing protein, partial [Alphaproteobacteria bacterium]|nr:SurA N-terminal domain-containing protein [Alphaproteobacteria bacterium]